MVDTAAAGAMFGFAVYAAHDISLEGWAPGELPAAVAALTVMVMFLVGPRGKGWEAEAGQDPRGGHKKEPAHIIDDELSSVSAARHSPAQALPSQPTISVSDTANDVHYVAPNEVQQQSVDQRNDGAAQTADTTFGKSPLARTANGWTLASFILEPSDAAWCDIRECLRQVARPETSLVIEAVVAAARRQWHTGTVPLKKDAFIADILAAPEVTALGKLQRQTDMVRKVLDGKHPTLIRASNIKRST
jgi:hypothetical protein